MSDPNKDEQQSQQPKADFFSELQELGKQFERTVRSAIDNERVHSFQRDMQNQFQDFFTQMQNAANRFYSDPDVQEKAERGKQAVDEAQQKAQENQILHDFQQTMSRGMSYFNQQVNEFASRASRSTETGETPAGEGTQPQSGKYDFFEEMRRLGETMQQTAMGLMSNERTQSFQRDIQAATQEFFLQMQNAAKTVQDDPRVKDFTERGRQTMSEAQQKAEENQVYRDLQDSLAKGIAYFNQQLDEFRERTQKSDQGESGAQNIPIDYGDESGAATGPTTRLDPDDTDPKKGA